MAGEAPFGMSANWNVFQVALATAAFTVAQWTIQKCEAQGSLGVVAGKGQSLIRRSDRCTFGIDGVDLRRNRMHLRDVHSDLFLPSSHFGTGS
jgi:hypothetical protein